MTEAAWLTRAMVEATHFDQIREHGGLLGVRDDGLSESALARLRQRWSLEPEADLASLAEAGLVAWVRSVLVPCEL